MGKDELEALLAKMAGDAVNAELASTLRELESLGEWADGEADKRQRQRAAARQHLQQRRASDNDTWTQLLAEFSEGAAAGRWLKRGEVSRNAAAAELATKYGFAESTVRKRLRKQ